MAVRGGIMETARLGKTEMVVSKVGCGGVPLQRASEDEAVAIVRRCLDLGITFFDTADNYTNSEERIGKAISGRQEGLVLSTKTDYGTRQEVEGNLKQSLRRLGTRSIDLYQFHGINDFDTYAKVIDPGGPIAVVQEAMKAGSVKHVGISSHSMDIAKEAVKSGLFETIMFPFNFVVCEAADELLPLTRQHDVGFIAMKPLAGGMLQNVTIAFKYLLQFPDVVSIPGVQRIHEVEEIVQVSNGPRQMTEAEQREMQRLREELGTRLCRRCGYCLPCPEGIPILLVMDITSMLKNMPPQTVFSPPIASGMERVAACTRCGECEERCTYGLPIMELIEEHASIYQAERRKYQLTSK
jgi:predicted aldo/keto reductase-like oxidoreductase